MSNLQESDCGADALQGVSTAPVAAGSTGRSLKQGGSFRSRTQSAASSHDSDSQQGMDQLTECRVDCWNGEYVEARQQAEASGQQQDWMAHNKEVLHEQQVR